MDSEQDRRIRELAYELWERAGRPDGGADEYWYEAERQLAAEAQGLREDPASFEGSAEETPEQPAPAKPSRRPTPR